MDELDANSTVSRKPSSNPRPVRVCARCRRRKIRCDSKFPRCTGCQKAGVACVGYAGSIGKDAPRSLVTYLESRARELEAELQALTTESTFHGLENLAHDSASEVMGTSLARAMLDVVTPSGSGLFAVDVSPSLYIGHSSLPSPFSRQEDVYDGENRSLEQSIRALNVVDVPSTAVDQLMQNYIDIHLPQHPIVYEPELLQACSKAVSEPKKATPFEVFITHMVLALSSNTLIWRNEQRAQLASEQFFLEALKQLPLMKNMENGLRAVQVALLLLHYSSMNPKVGDAWYCLGEAARMCIHLGLHKEPQTNLDLDPLTLDTRRRLFWMTYGFERFICSLLHLPFSLEEDSITTKFPSDLDDASITSEGILQGIPKKASAIHMWQLRELESEVHRVLWLQQDMKPDFELISWYSDITARVYDWHQQSLDFAKEKKLEFRDVQLHMLLLRLHRATPRQPSPPLESRLQSARSAIALISEYDLIIKQGRLYYTWFATLQIFETAVVFFDDAWMSAEMLVAEMDPATISQNLQLVISLLRKLAERWPAVKKCADSLDAIITPILRRLNVVAGGSFCPRDEATTRALTGLLFPDSDLSDLEELERFFTSESIGPDIPLAINVSDREDIDFGWLDEWMPDAAAAPWANGDGEDFMDYLVPF